MLTVWRRIGNKDDWIIFKQQEITKSKELKIGAALIPVFALIAMLAYNVFVFGDEALSGSNQFILLMGGAVAAAVGFYFKVPYKKMLEEVSNNVRSTTGALLILLFVGANAITIRRASSVAFEASPYPLLELW